MPASSRSALWRVEVGWPQFVADSGGVSVHENDLHTHQVVEGGACGGLLFLCFFPAPRALNPSICFAVWLLQRANISKFRVSECLSVTNTLFPLSPFLQAAKSRTALGAAATGTKSKSSKNSKGNKNKKGSSNSRVLRGAREEHPRAAPPPSTP